MYRFSYKAYRRAFAGSFSNARESFPKREGILVRLEDRDGRVGFGEAAPIASFGSESLPFALALAEEMGERYQPEVWDARLAGLPCMRWALESAVEMLECEGAYPESGEDAWPVCHLLSDAKDLQEFEERRAMHFRCMKIKIGKQPLADELRALGALVERSEGQVEFRLDANGTLDGRQTRAWLEALEGWPVEFLEQPMEKGAEGELFRLAEDYPTPLALDESVCSVDDLKRWRDAQWPGVFVLKPSLSGGLRDLRAELARGDCDVVYSSSLETMVGAAAALRVGLTFPGKRRALGFGVEDLFADNIYGLSLGPFLQRGGLPDSDELQLLWNQI